MCESTLDLPFVFATSAEYYKDAQGAHTCTAGSQMAGRKGTSIHSMRCVWRYSTCITLQAAFLLSGRVGSSGRGVGTRGTRPAASPPSSELSRA